MFLQWTSVLSLRGLLLAAGEKPSVLSWSTSSLSSQGYLLVVSALVAFNYSIRAREIAADAWEREQGSCLLKKVQLQSGRKRGKPGEESLFP